MTASADAVSTAPAPPSDAQLIAEVRAGHNEAYAELFERHHSAAVGLARRYARNASDAEDLASEGFANVLTALQSGSGPDAFFRAYLFTSISRLAARGNIKARRQTLSDEMERYEGEQPYDDPVMAGFESDTVANAFRTLPERWQAVLWYTEVDGMQPAAVAPLLGLSPNAVSALALRAREGLRQAYLQAHVSATAVDDECAPFADKLGAYARNGLSARNSRKVREHLSDCPRCTAALLQLEDVGHGMRGIVFPLVTALPFVTPAVGKIVAGGFLVGGVAWFKEAFSKIGTGNAVVGGLVIALAVAGGIAFASLGQPTTTAPAVPSSAPSVSAQAGGLGTGSAGKAAPVQLPPPAPAQEPGQEPPAPVYVAPAPVPAPEPPVAAPAPLRPVPAPTPFSTPPVTQSASAPPSPTPTAAPAPLYTLTAATSATSSLLASQEDLNLKAVPAKGPSQPTTVVVTLHYSSLTQPTWSSTWSCMPGPTVTGQAAMTCTTPFVTGGQIPTLTLDWPALSQPSISGTAVLDQGGTPVSNTATF